jgi:outer membrane lipoprotein-sorting protein
MKKLLLLMSLSLALFALSNEEIAKKSDDQMSGFGSSFSTMQMTLRNASGQQTLRKMESKVLEAKNDEKDNKEGDKSLMTFLTPADVAGTKLLNHEHLEEDDDQWMYLPALKRVKRIASRNKSGSFMGSEFSYEDISAQNYRKFTYDTTAAKIVSLGKVECYQSVRRPKDKNSGYSKQMTWIDSTNFLVQKIDYYDKKGALLKTAHFRDYQQMGSVWRIGTIEMHNHQNLKTTLLEWKEDSIHQKLRDKDFHRRVLKK